MELSLLIILVADRLTGEPDFLWRRVGHPVTWMANLLMWGEDRFNRDELSPLRGKVYGASWVLCLAILAGAISWTLEYLLHSLLPAPWALVVAAVLGSVFIAHRSLIEHVQAVSCNLEKCDLEGARTAVSQIVGRETSSLDEASVSRAAIESLAENFSDGVVAPAFWFCLAGLPGLVVYKFINTADSMIGHKSLRFQYFGFGAARLDDALNFVPARISAVLLTIGTLGDGRKDPGRGLKTAWTFASLHASPNAGWPEATMAGLLGVRVGGPRSYAEGRKKDNAWLGEGRDVQKEDLSSALVIVQRSWLITVAVLVLLVASQGVWR